MELIADILMTSGALAAGMYCLVLSRRLSRFNDLERGMGGAVAMLSVQVDDLKRALEDAKTSATHTASSLEEAIDRADEAARRLERSIASGEGSSDTPGRVSTPERRVRRRRREAPSVLEGAA